MVKKSLTQYEYFFSTLEFEYKTIFQRFDFMVNREEFLSYCIAQNSDNKSLNDFFVELGQNGLLNHNCKTNRLDNELLIDPESL